MKIKRLILILFLAFFTACAKQEACVEAAAPQYNGEVKNIILIVGDGMGPEQIGLLAQYAKYAKNPIYKDRESNIEKYLNKAAIALTLTSTKTTLVTDSAASGTHIATGVYTLPGAIGMDHKNKAQTTILEKAKAAGKSTGLITDVYLQDATPASFSAHRPNRAQRDEIARDMLNNEVDVMLGGGLKYFGPLIKNFEEKGYTVALNKKDFNAVNGAQTSKLLGVFSELEMPYAISKNKTVPEYKDLAVKALEILSKNPNGFFLMYEGGKIDWTAHDNDAGAMFSEMLAFDHSLGYIMQWAQNNPGTLVVLTADHDTGGFGFEYSYLSGKKLQRAKSSGEVLYGGATYYVNPNVYDRLLNQKGRFYSAQEEFDSLPYDKKTPKEMSRLIGKVAGAPVPEDIFRNCKDFLCAQRAYHKSLGIVWSTGAHTSNPVITAAYGPGQEFFSGIYHTTDLNKKLTQAAGL